ncbi:protein ALP1-like [Pimephales promelas]|nr:protein ALP1-like [Pimephales promelas]KAG1944176.1 protein ALP1-like [Pimephales promelas]
MDEAASVVLAVLCAEKRKKRKKTRQWTRSWIAGREQYGLSILQRELEDSDRKGFRELLRMDVEDFSYLLGKVRPFIQRRDTKLRRAISARMRLSLTLRFLATGETFRSLSFQYRIGRSTISEIVMETCQALYEVLKDDHLKTPTTEAEWREVAMGFENKWQFPNCLGAIDGKHIYIQPPANSGSTYHNYKSRFSVVLMAVVDADYRFIYANVGVQGRVSDGGIFGQSDLRAAMDRDLLNVPPPEPLPGSNISLPYAFIGDEAFPLRIDLMKPYPFRNLDHGQRIFNYRLSRARRTVENAFGILANRLRVFLSNIALEPEKVTTVTLAALCVHNFLRKKASDVYLPSAFADVEDDNHNIVPGAWRRDGELPSVAASSARNATTAAKNQRDNLKAYFLSPAGSVSWQENMI